MKLIYKRTLSALAIGSVAFGTFALAGTAFAASIVSPAGGGESGELNESNQRGQRIASSTRPTFTRMGDLRGTKRGANPNALFQGNGQPIVGGNVTAINGTTLTIVNKSNVTYTVDATNATVSKRSVTGATLSSIAIGDSVVVQGTVNGNAVTAVSVLDQGTLPSTTSGSTGTNPPAHGGFMGAIGGFFSHLFGFF